MFTFKSFTIRQAHAAMKVCTDACILGAWVNPGPYRRILDIGTGTGLLSLMLAQRTEGEITAVEIDPNACLDADHNFSNSIYQRQITLFCESIQLFADRPQDPFDLIISNPPFFQNDLKSPDRKINSAHHDTLLNFNELISAVVRLLSERGDFWLLLPPSEMDIFRKMADRQGLALSSLLTVSHRAEKKPLRQIASFSKYTVAEIMEEQLCIYEKDNRTYTPTFQALLKDYYTIF